MNGELDLENAADAAVIQLATMAMSYSAQLDDPRITEIAAVCRKQIEKGDTIATLLKLLAHVNGPPTSDQKRVAQREKAQAAWQESLQARMAIATENNKRSSELQARLAEQLLEQLSQKTKTSKPVSLDNDERATSGTDSDDEGVDSVPESVSDTSSSNAGPAIEPSRVGR